jgi:hypothetical protein
MEMEEGPDDGGAGVPLAPPPPQLKIESKTEQGGGGSGWGVWGGWRTSAFSVLSELQKAATEAAEEISKNVSFCCSFFWWFFVCCSFESHFLLPSPPLPSGVPCHRLRSG